nr:MAG TPA: hypothetical protein [Bacteriophage sp.]
MKQTTAPNYHSRGRLKKGNRGRLYEQPYKCKL